MGFSSDKLISYVISLLLITCTSCKRHTIYWDTRLEPRLKNELVLEVEVGDWMDILCPHKSSFNRSALDSNNLYLEVFNVSEAHYRHCAVTGQQRLLHCKNPRQEIKLTAKFQTRSPSPIGFIFRPGHTYYYMSKPIQKKTSGCNSDTLRMKVMVKEQVIGRKSFNIQRDSERSYKSISAGDSSKPRRHHVHKKLAPRHDKLAVKNRLEGSENVGDTAPPDGKSPPGNSAPSSLSCNISKTWIMISCLIFFLINAALV